MKIHILFIISIPLLVLGCQNSNEDSDHMLKDSKVNSPKLHPPSIETNNNSILPTYGSNEPRADNAIVTEYESRNSGRLTIQDGCVTLTYPKDHYPESVSPENFTRMPIFPGGSKFIQNGQAIDVNGKIYRDGDYVEMSGRGTVREFWTSFPPDMPYTPIPEHCTADEYWEVGATGLSLMD